MSWLSQLWKGVKKSIGAPTDAELVFWLYVRTLSTYQRSKLRSKLLAVQFAIDKASELAPGDARLMVAQEWINGGLAILEEN
jgi:hypothetical protein